jgi:hypothetical protein
MLRVSGTLQKSTDVMKLVNDTLKLPEMQKTMFEMSKGAVGSRRACTHSGGTQRTKHCRHAKQGGVCVCELQADRSTRCYVANCANFWYVGLPTLLTQRYCCCQKCLWPRIASSLLFILSEMCWPVAILMLPLLAWLLLLLLFRDG